MSESSGCLRFLGESKVGPAGYYLMRTTISSRWYLESKFWSPASKIPVRTQCEALLVAVVRRSHRTFQCVCDHTNFISSAKTTLDGERGWNSGQKIRIAKYSEYQGWLRD
jgi:hypothetical protein